MKTKSNKWTPLHCGNKPSVPDYQKKLDDKVRETLKDDPRIATHEIECYIEKIINVELADGFNYEGREGFVAFGLREFKQMLKNIQPNE